MGKKSLRFVSVGIIYFTILIPSVRAVLRVPTVNIVLYQHTSGSDGFFNFHLRATNLVEYYAEDLNVQTVSNFGSTTVNVLATSGNTIFVDQQAPSGWNNPEVTCSSDDASVAFATTAQGVEIVRAVPFTTINCDFTNARKILKTPILIVPGVLGTNISKGEDRLWLDLGHNFSDIGDQFMDPLKFSDDLVPFDNTLVLGEIIREATVTPATLVNFNYTQGLINEFINQGYIEGSTSDSTLFTFPYDWRYGVTGIDENGRTAEDLLQQKIQQIKTLTGSEKVDIIAHSTGGLIVKKYVIDHPEDNYVGKAVFVGVPNTGAPKAVKVLLQGDNFGIPWLADAEMKKLSENLPVVYDLLPSEEYFKQKGSYIKIVNEGFLSSSATDLDFAQATKFLSNDHGLNSGALANASKLHTESFDNFDLRNAGVDLYSINGCKAGTISEVTERRVKKAFGDPAILFDQPKESPGDGTVPLESATNLPIEPMHKYYALKADHGKMPSQDGIRQEIVNIISGATLNVDSNLITQDIGNCHLNGKAISIFSPLDINVTDQYGNQSGLLNGAIQNDIPNADFEILGDHKFVYLPTDENQIYKIDVKGTGEGTFTLKSEDVSNDEVTNTQIFQNIPVTNSMLGQLNINGTTTLALDTNGDGSIDKTLYPSDPTPNIASVVLAVSTPEALVLSSGTSHGVYVSTTSSISVATTSQVYTPTKKSVVLLPKQKIVAVAKNNSIVSPKVISVPRVESKNEALVYKSIPSSINTKFKTWWMWFKKKF